MRIVSLLPSTTEIICDLGLAPQLLGVTVECNWPEGIRDGREIVVDTFTNPSMSPSEIDAIVRERVAAGLDLYILDEPLSGLDPSARIRVKTLLEGLKKAGRTLFVTSHALHDIGDICDHMVILHEGQPRFRGPPQQLLDTYGEISMERAFLRCLDASHPVKDD